MHLHTPSRAIALWGVGFSLALAVIPLIMYSGNLYYAEGGNSPDAPGMLLASVVITSPGWIAIWLCIIAPYLIGYSGEAPLAVGFGATFTSILLSMIAFLLTGFFLWLACARIEFWKLSRVPFTAHLVGCAIYVQFLRAAAVHRSTRNGPSADRGPDGSEPPGR